MYMIAKKSLGQRDALTGLNVTLHRIWKGFHMIHELPEIESMNNEKTDESQLCFVNYTFTVNCDLLKLSAVNCY